MFRFTTLIERLSTSFSSDKARVIVVACRWTILSMLTYNTFNSNSDSAMLNALWYALLGYEALVHSRERMVNLIIWCFDRITNTVRDTTLEVVERGM